MNGLRAYDRAHVPDSVGRIHLDRVPICKACVSPYRGSEIPGWEELSLDPNKTYRLLRDPDEIAKAAPTFNGVQLLARHTPVSADDHQPYDVVGTVGTRAEWAHPLLYNDVSLWSGHAISGVEDETKRELSPSYEYDADMRPGTYEGEPYDGVMRNLRGNHVALVVKGRQGPEVAIDEALIVEPQRGTEPMTKTVVPSRTAVRLQAAFGALAMDAKLDFKDAFLGVTAKNLAAQKPRILKVMKAAYDALPDEMQPAVQAGATPDDVIMKILDMVENQTAAEPAEMDMTPNAGPPATETATGATPDVVEWLRSKGVDEAILAELASMLGGSEVDEPVEDPPTEEEKAKDAKMVTKSAMDAALEQHGKAVEQRVRKTQREIVEAASFVRPWVGELAMDSVDCAADVYRKALTSLGVSGAATMHADALRPVLEAQTKPGSANQQHQSQGRLAADAATEQSLAERFPHAAKILVA